jgi:hypothetical protein
MMAIRFTDSSKLEEGLRLIMDNGLVEYTEREDTFIVPIQTTVLLDEEEIPYIEIPYEEVATAYEISTTMQSRM